MTERRAVWFDVHSLIDPSIKGGEIVYGQEDTEEGHGKLADNGWKNVVTMLALQGLVNRKGPRLMYDTQFWNWKPADRVWREIYAERKGFEFEELPDMWSVIERLRDDFRGLAVHDPEIEQSLYVACMHAALEDLLPVSPEVAAGLGRRLPGIPTVHDFQGRWKDEWEPLDYAIEELLPRCRPGMGYSVDRLWSGMSIDALDLAVARKAFIYRCSTNPRHRRDNERIWRIHQGIGPNAGIYGWGEPEDRYCEMASLNSNYIMCAEAPNLSFHAQVPAARAVWRQKSHRDTSALRLEDRFYVAFMTTEGDALKIHTVFQGGAWHDPNRGKVPINWGFQPRMLDIAPAMAEYYYDTMTENDYFFCGCSGAGYTYPNWMPEPELFMRESDQYMRAADLQVMDCWIHFSRPVYEMYARLSPHTQAFVMPAGPVQVKMTGAGTPVILRHGSLHYYPNGRTPGQMAESIREAAAQLDCRPAFLTVFAVPDANENRTSQGGFSPSDYVRVAELLPEEDFKIVTLEEMAWAAKEFLKQHPEWANRPMTRAPGRSIGVNVTEE